MYNALKKTFTFSVVATTIMWSVGVAALIPSVAQGATCPTLASGDMIKVVGKPAIYSVNNGLKVLYFPSGDEFKSWNVDNKYGGYISVTQECFDSLAVPSTYPGAVNYRAGSYVVKRPSSDQLYVVEPGNTLAKITTTDAKALYGTNYTVKTVADAFWPHYVNRGTDIAGKAHEGMLVSKDSKTWYVDSGNVLREVTATGMTANRFKTAFIHTVAASYLSGFTTGTAIDAAISSFDNRTQDGTIVAPPAATGPVTVSLAADTPAAATIPDKATGVEYLKFVVKAGSSATTLNEVVLHRIGVGSYADFDSVYVYDGNTRLTSGRTVASDTNKVIVPNLKVNLAAGESRTLRVLVDIAAAGTTSGNVDGFEVYSANGNTVTGVTGNYMTLGGADVSAVTVDNSGTSGTFTLGASQVEMARGTISASSATYDVKVTRMTLTNAGSLSNSYIKNLKLTIGSTDVATAASMTDDKVIFTLATPYTITKGDQKTFYVYADCTGGRVSDTVKFYVDETSDVGILDSQYNVGVALTNSFGSGNQTYTTTGGDLTLANNGPAAGNIGRNITNVILQKFSFSSTNAVTVKNTKIWVYLKHATAGTALPYASTTEYGYIKNVKIVDLDNSNQTVVGPWAVVTTGGTGSGNSYYDTFTDNYSVAAGVTRHFAVMADIDSSATNGLRVWTMVDYSVASTVKYDDNSEYVTNTSIVPNTLTGNEMTINAAGLTVGKSTPPASATVVKGSTQDTLGISLTAGTASDVKITSMKLRVFASTTAITSDKGDTAGNTVVNTVSLYEDGASTALATKNLSDSTGGTSYVNGTDYYYVTFNNGFNYIVPAGTTKKLIVKLALKGSTATTYYVSVDTDPYDDMSVETATDGKTVTVSPGTGTAINSSSPIQLTDIVAGGLTVSVDGTTPLADVATAGSTGVAMATYRLLAANENFTITGLAVSSTASYYTDVKKVNITYKDKDGNTVTKVCYLDTNDTCKFTDGQLDIYAIKNQNTLVTLSADFNTITSEGATSGHAVQIGLSKIANQFGSADKLTDDFIALGESSNTKLKGTTDYATSATNAKITTVLDSTVTAKTVRKTKVTVAESDSGSTSHVTKSQDTVGVFTFTSESEPGANQNSTLLSMTVQLSGNLIASSAGNGQVTLTFYNGSTFDTAHLMGTKLITTVDTASTDSVTADLSSYNEWTGTKTVYVVADTTDTDFSDTGSNVEKLTTKLTTFKWYDGSSYNAVPITGIPLYGKTYSY